MITVNTFFARWITDIDIRRYPDNTRILPTNNNVDVCQFAAFHLKYLPKDSVKTIMKQLLYSNKPVYLAEGTDRRPNNDDSVDKCSDVNIKDGIAQFSDLIFTKNYFRILLGILVNLGLVNFSMKTDTKFLFTLQRNMNKLFESTKKLAAIPDEPHALIQFHNRPYIAYQKITLTQNFDIYFSGIIRSETAVRIGLLPAPYQQLFVVNKRIQSLTVTFKGAQRQFERLEISLVYDKSYQHVTIYDSFDLELVAKMIQSIKFENTTSTYSLTGKLECNYKNEDEKNTLYKMFAAYNCNGCSTTPLTQYKNNEIYQYIIPEEEYRLNTRDDRIYIDMRRSQGYTDELEKLTRDDSGLVAVINLKKAAKKKMRLRITGFSQAEYWYVLSNKGCIKTIIFQKKMINNFVN